jgi:hypothetical protein
MGGDSSLRKNFPGTDVADERNREDHAGLTLGCKRRSAWSTVVVNDRGIIEPGLLVIPGTLSAVTC